MMVAINTPTSSGIIRSHLPMITGIPIGSSRLFAAENVAPEMAVWIMFWLWILRYFCKNFNGILERMIANKAPTIDVLGATPVRTISSKPMIAPSTLITTFRMTTWGANAFGCSAAVICSCSYDFLLCSSIVSPPFLSSTSFRFQNIRSSGIKKANVMITHIGLTLLYFSTLSE